MKTAEDIVKLFELGKETAALSLVHEMPRAYCDLPRSLRDHEKFALTAISQMPSILKYATPRLKSSIDFFIKVFSKYSNRQLSFSSEHDLLFMLEFVRVHHGYRHDIGERQVAKFFSQSAVSPASLEKAKALSDHAHFRESWITYDKVSDINILESQFPGFSKECYECAHRWAWANKTSREGEWRF